MADRPVILTVGSNKTNLDLLAQQLAAVNYDTYKATSLEELGEALNIKTGFAMALVDVSGFDQSIWKYCEQLRINKIPFIVISPQRSHSIQRDSMQYGASAILVKPLGVKELLEFVRTLLGDI